MFGCHEKLKRNGIRSVNNTLVLKEGKEVKVKGYVINFPPLSPKTLFSQFPFMY